MSTLIDTIFGGSCTSYVHLFLIAEIQGHSRVLYMKLLAITLDTTQQTVISLSSFQSLPTCLVASTFDRQ